MNGGIFLSKPCEPCLLNTMTTILNSVLAKLSKAVRPYAFHTLIKLKRLPTEPRGAAPSEGGWQHEEYRSLHASTMYQLPNLKALGQPGRKTEEITRSQSSVHYLSEASFPVQAQMLNRNSGDRKDFCPIQTEWPNHTIPSSAPREIPLSNFPPCDQ